MPPQVSRATESVAWLCEPIPDYDQDALSLPSLATRSKTVRRFGLKVGAFRRRPVHRCAAAASFSDHCCAITDCFAILFILQGAQTQEAKATRSKYRLEKQAGKSRYEVAPDQRLAVRSFFTAVGVTAVLQSNKCLWLTCDF